MKGDSKRIGLFGGMFDPIHNGHLAIAQVVLQSLSLHEIIFIPCGSPVHKNEEGSVPIEKRVHMVSLAIKKNPHYKLSTIEVKKNKISFTIDTVKYFLKQYHYKDLFFIIGSDSLYELYTWKEIDLLVSLCQFVVVLRKGFPIKSLQSSPIRLKETTFKKCIANSIEIEPIEISSTMIRNYRLEGKTITGLVPKEVEEYIVNEDLYHN
ncbi:nicotinate-nucleotide adenylyltransferase [Chlamydiota bacterium]